MVHFGDITKIKGDEVPAVDVITGGSPCQDLSVAGKRAGLAGERSGLFMEQIRLIKEMRNESKRRLSMRGTAIDIRHIQPRYTVWENVYGAFSSNNGEDFRAVLEETVKVADENAYVPGLEKGQKWASAGCIMGDGYSVAWRVHDAQYWGVPQRRRRLCVLADYGGGTAPEILFELLGEAEYTEAVKIVADFDSQSRSEVQAVTESVPGYSEPSGTQRQETTGYSENGIGTAISFQERAGKPGGGKGILIQNEHTGALSTLNNQAVVYSLQGSMIGREDKNGPQGDGVNEDVSFTLNTTDRHVVCYGMDNERRRGIDEFDDLSPAITARAGTGGNNVPVVIDDIYCESVCASMQAIGEYKISDAASALKQRNYKDATDLIVASFYPQRKAESICFTPDVSVTLTNGSNPGFQNGIVTYGLDRASYNQGKNAKYDFSIEEEKIGSMTAKGPGAVFSTVVRRMTPFECGRLQGYPDGWMDIGEWVDSKGKVHKDSDAVKYKAAGNSIALPFWEWMMHRISEQLKQDGSYDLKMASLFDGIGGFPLVASRAGITPVWASEIEEFPIAVTKARFKEE